MGLYPKGSFCAEVKARNSSGRCGVDSVADDDSESIWEVLFSSGIKEQEEEKVVEKNKVSRFVDKRRKRKRRLVEREYLAFCGESMEV